MAESGGSSRKKQQGGFGLFKPSRSSRRSRRRTAANGTSQSSNTQLSAPPPSYPSQTLNLPTVSGDSSQTIALGASSNTRKNRSNPFAWLFGGRSDRRSKRSQPKLGNSFYVEQSQSRLPNDRSSGSNNRPNPDSRRMSRPTAPTLPNLAYPTASAQGRDRATESRLSRDIKRANGKRLPNPTSNGNAPKITDQRVPALPGSPTQGSFSKTLVPFPPQASRSELKSRRGQRRSPRTQLQVADTALTPQPTALQQITVLQNQEAISDGQSTGPGRRAERNLSRPRSRSTAIALYIARMLILSIGVGVLAGTVLSAWNPGNTLFLADASHQAVKPAESPPAVAPSAHPASAPLELTTEIAPLKTKLQTLIQQSPGFAPGLFLIDLDNYNYLDITGSVSFPAASMIKVPILIAFFQDVDAGKIRLDEKLTMRKDMVAQGSGEMQYLQPGAQFTALETATQMIIVSDNTATNMLIARLGGIAALNERFKSWGLTTTTLKSVLPDLQGTNQASPKELASLMVRVSQGELVSMRSRDRMLSIMQRTVNNSQLPQGLGEGATIAHKTGDIGTLIGDMGLVDMPNGKRYAAAVMVKRAFNDDRAYELVQKMSSIIYQHLNGTTKGAGSVPAPVLSPSPTTSASPNAEEEGVETDTYHSPDAETDTHHSPDAETDAQRIPDSELTPTDNAPAVADPAQASNQ